MNRNLALSLRRSPVATRSAVEAGSNISLDTSDHTVQHQQVSNRRRRTNGLGRIMIACGVLLVAGCSNEPGVRSRTADRDVITTDPDVTIDPNAVSEPTTPDATPEPVAITPPPVELPSDLPITESGTEQIVRFTPFTVIDPAANGVTAFSLIVPEGWQASGDVQWLPTWARAAFLNTRVVDPTTGLTIDWLPVQNFISFTPPAGFDVPLGGNYQGKQYGPPITDPLQFVRDFWMPDVLSLLQNATVVSVIELPAAADEAVRGSNGQATAGAWRIRYEYEFEGVVWEQDVSFSLLYIGSDIVSWFVNDAYTVGAPKGQLDRQAGIVSAIAASRRTTVEWEANYRLVLQLFYQGIQQQMADTVALGQLLAQYRAESQALQQQVFDERMASQDRQAEVFRDTLGGVQPYNDPVNGGIVQLPLGWDTYWVNSQGEYIAVSDPNFDPNSLNDGVWEQLEPRG